MGNLPNQTDDTSSNVASVQVSTTPQGKEGEVVRVGVAEFPLQEVGNEINLPKEVVSSGVQMHPTQATLPPSVVSQGVEVINQTRPEITTPGNSAVLPLTDEQIAKGLHASVTSSIRWLAEWCVRKLKMVHGAVTTKKS